MGHPIVFAVWGAMRTMAKLNGNRGGPSSRQSELVLDSDSPKPVSSVSCHCLIIATANWTSPPPRMPSSLPLEPRTTRRRIVVQAQGRTKIALSFLTPRRMIVEEECRDRPNAPSRILELSSLALFLNSSREKTSEIGFPACCEGLFLHGSAMMRDKRLGITRNLLSKKLEILAKIIRWGL